MNEIAKRLGVSKVEVKETLFSELLKKLINDNNIDMAAGGIYITPEREEIVAFTEPLYKESEAVIVQLLNELNKIIEEMKADGSLYAILVDNGLDKNNMIMK